MLIAILLSHITGGDAPPDHTNVPSPDLSRAFRRLPGWFVDGELRAFGRYFFVIGLTSPRLPPQEAPAF